MPSVSTLSLRIGGSPEDELADEDVVQGLRPMVTVRGPSARSWAGGGGCFEAQSDPYLMVADEEEEEEEEKVVDQEAWLAGLTNLSKIMLKIHLIRLSFPMFAVLEVNVILGL